MLFKIWTIRFGHIFSVSSKFECEILVEIVNVLRKLVFLVNSRRRAIWTYLHDEWNDYGAVNAIVSLWLRSNFYSSSSFY